MTTPTTTTTPPDDAPATDRSPTLPAAPVWDATTWDAGTWGGQVQPPTTENA